MRPHTRYVHSVLPPHDVRAALARTSREHRWPPRGPALRAGGPEPMWIAGGAHRFRVWARGIGSRTVPVLACRAEMTPTGGSRVRVRVRPTRSTQVSGVTLGVSLGGMPVLAGWGSPMTLLLGGAAGLGLTAWLLFSSFSPDTRHRAEELIEALESAARVREPGSTKGPAAAPGTRTRREARSP